MNSPDPVDPPVDAAAEADHRALRKLVQRLRVEAETAMHLAEILRGVERVTDLRGKLDERGAGPAMTLIGQAVIDALVAHLMEMAERKKQHRACLPHIFQRLEAPQTRLLCLAGDAEQEMLLAGAEEQWAVLVAGAAADLKLARIRNHHLADNLMGGAEVQAKLQEVYGLLDGLLPIVEDLSRLMGIATDSFETVRQAAADKADHFWLGYAG